MLAAGAIRDDLQAHLALARVGEEPRSSTPISLPVRTTGKSYEPATARASSFRFEPAKQELTVGPDLARARPAGRPPRFYLASKGAMP